jgi:PKD repeat protein
MRHSPSRAIAVLLILLLTEVVLTGRPAAAATGDIGYEGPSYAGATAGSHPSASKPESKLWWNDGIWWADMVDAVSGRHRIFRLNLSTQTWSNTGVNLDDRAGARSDTLWDGAHLYVASHVFTTSPSSGKPSRLYRYSYALATKTYSLDSGFPVSINNYATETLVIDKDSAGKLWATWVQNNQVYVNRTTTDDRTWATPFVLPVSGVSVAKDDISSVVAMNDDTIGVMWSNQNDSKVYFAVHVDGTSDTTWQTSRTALIGPKSADDHINLKTVHADRSGRVYAAVKTSFTTSSAPLIMLLVRDPATGNWDNHVVARVSDSHTRPIVLINEENRTIHVFATGPQPPSTSGQSGGSIYKKTSAMDSISFPLGYGTPVIRDADAPEQNDVTSTKQNLNSTTGMVVLATNGTTRRYWHAYESFGPAPPPPDPPGPPVASFTATPTSGVAPLAVQFTDMSTGGTPTSWQWSFGDGATSTQPSPLHTYTAGGSFDVSLTVSNGAGSSTSTVPAMIQTVSPPPPNGSSTFAPVADAYVKSDLAGSNFGSKTFVRVAAGTSTARSYLKFDVSGLNATVVSARLRLHVADGSTNGGAVYLIGDTTWQENTITWANAPPITGTPSGAIGPVPTVGAWVETDITGAVNGNGTVTLAISDGVANGANYDSRETANDPQLIIGS